MSSENEKTMRPGTDPESTMRPGGQSEKTMRPDNQPNKTLRPDGQANKTLRPDGQINKTLRPDTAGTLRPQDQQDEIDRIVRQDEDEYILGKGVKYKVVRVISKSTGEADIFLVENNGKRFVLKLYFPTFKQDHSILDIIAQNAGSGLLVDTLEHGVWTNPRTQQERDYELMAYCEGGSLDQFKISHDEKGEKCLGEIALKCACSLDFLHKKQLIHGDVKPANFFFRNKDQNIENLELGDFGIAKKCNKEGVVEIPHQERTKIYAAPEYYDYISGNIQISTKSDFFALGMTLLTLWCGEGTFDQMNEFQLKNQKKHGTLSYPQDMSDRMLQLVKALTHPDPNVRASLSEVIRWANNENIYDLKSGKDDIRKFNILFKKDQTATSPEELAKFMLEDKALATKYLYSGKLAGWLSDNLRPELAQGLEDFTEKKYPKDENAGLYASCYLLDEALPYYDVKNKKAETSEEIAQSLLDNFAHYQTALLNENDSLFLFLNARGAANITQTFSPLFKPKGNNRDALLQLIHTLNPALPWIITTEENLKIECYSPEDVLKANYEHIPNDESWNDLISEAFLVWLRHNNPAIEGKIRSQKGFKDRQTVVLYNLNPQVSYNFQLDDKANDYFFTAEEIGNYMNIRMEEYIINSEDSYASEQLDMMCDIENTRLYDYFKSKGLYDDKIEWIKHCADIKSKDNENKPGPYNWRIGVYKAIKGLGFDPYYYFPKSKKRVYTLDELKQIPLKEQKEELKKGYLESWLTTFYQEDPNLDLSKKFTYEKEMVKFLGHLEKIDPKDSDVVNYNIGKNAVEKTLSSLKRKRNIFIWSKILVGLLTLLASLAIIYGLLVLKIPIDVKDHVGWISLVAGFVAILGVIAMYFFSDTGCLINLIVGALIGAAIYAILYFGIAFVGYIVIGLLVFFLVLWIVNSYFKYSIVDKTAKAKGVNHTVLFNPTFEERHLEPLHFAYSDDQSFKSSIGDQSYAYGDYLSIGTEKFYRQLIIPWILILASGALLFFFSPNFNNLSAQMFTPKSSYESFLGNWNGTFDNTRTTFTISEANKDEVYASILVNYKKPLQEMLKGTIDMETKTFRFDDINPSNGILDGGYKGSFDADFASFSGEYENYKSKKVVKFNFSKEIVAEAPQEKTQPVEKKTSKTIAETTKPQETQTNETQTGETKPEKMQTPTDATGWYNQGIAYSNEGKYSEAVSSFQEAVDLDPTMGGAWNGMGNAYLNLKKYNEAILCYKYATGRDKNNDTAWYNLGVCYDAQNNQAEAQNAYKKAAELGNKKAQTHLGIEN